MYSNKDVLITMTPPPLPKSYKYSIFYVLNPYLFLSNYVIIVGIEKKIVYAMVSMRIKT